MRAFGANALLVAEGGGGGKVSKIVLNGAKTEGKRTVLKSGFPDGPVRGDRGRRERVRARGSARGAVRAAGLAASAREAVQSDGGAGRQALITSINSVSLVIATDVISRRSPRQCATSWPRLPPASCSDASRRSSASPSAL